VSALVDAIARLQNIIAWIDEVERNERNRTEARADAIATITAWRNYTVTQFNDVDDLYPMSLMTEIVDDLDNLAFIVTGESV
jgi:hypothetical protein